MPCTPSKVTEKVLMGDNSRYISEEKSGYTFCYSTTYMLSTLRFAGIMDVAGHHLKARVDCEDDE